jgi:recombination protein RecA
MSLDALSKALLGALGANSEVDRVTAWVDSTYPPLNKIMGGFYKSGFPYGRIIEIFGPSASGKTLLATLAMIQAQQNGGFAIFIDYERSFNADLARQLGLDTTFPRFIYKRAETWESGNTEMMKAVELIRSTPEFKDCPIVAVQDSVAAAVPKSMMYDKDGKKRGIDELTMNDTTALARVTSTTLKAINQYVGDFSFTAIYLNQIRTKPGVTHGDPTTTPGGGAMEYYASVRLSLGRKKLMQAVGGEKEFVGNEITIKTPKNKLTRPFQSVDLRLMYDADGKAVFDFATGLLDHLVDTGVLKMAGSYLEWEGKKVYKSVLLKEPGIYERLCALVPDDSAEMAGGVVVNP